MIEFIIAAATIVVSLIVADTFGYRAFNDWLYRDGSGVKVIAITTFGIVAVPASVAALCLLS